MSFGKTIRIYLPDGSPTGLKHVELVNWTGQAMFCPRVRLPELADWHESQRPGVYLLFGRDASDQGGSLAYIGEAENVFGRLKQHTSKQFWDSAVFFTSKDENLTKAHIKYLESRMIQLAHEAGRVELDNKDNPNLPSLPRSDRDAMEEYLATARTVLAALGYPLLQPLVESSASSLDEDEDDDDWPILHFENAKRGVNAIGSPSDEGFVVHAGSVAAKSVTKGIQSNYKRLRQELIDNAVIALRDGQLVFPRNALFGSSTAAATVLMGYNVSGPQYWSDANGRTLKEIEEAWLEEAEAEED